MREVFADSFYYIALLNPTDRFHAAAVQATRDLTCRLVTTGDHHFAQAGFRANGLSI